MELDSFAADKSDVAGFFVGSDARQIGSLSQSIGKPNIDLPRHLEGEHFVRGPIPMEWLKLAASCGYSAISVSLLLWYAAGLQRSNPVKLSRKILQQLKVHPKTAKRVLRCMEEIGLVQVEFKRGRSPIVTITSPPAQSA